MSADESRPSDNFGLWFVLSSAVIMAVAMFSASREKTPLLFSAGFGLVCGLLLRTLAGQLNVGWNRRVIFTAMLLTAIGFAGCFGLGYRRAASEWKSLQSTGPEHPLAAALLEKFPDRDPAAIVAAQQRFTLSDYLSRRMPKWPSPWPLVLCGAEWLGTVVIAGLCVGVSIPSRARQRPVAEASSSKCSK